MAKNWRTEGIEHWNLFLSLVQLSADGILFPVLRQAFSVSGQLQRQQHDKMKLDFDNIFEHKVLIDDFQLNWRFKDEKYDRLPDLHLEQLLPLDKDASEYLWNYITNAELHSEYPFKKTFFSTIHETIVLNDNDKEVKTWLYERGLPLDKYVFLSWQKTIAMIVPWKLLIKYFDSFYYRSSDDLTIIDQSLNWALLFHHDNQIYFGTTDNYKPSKNFENTNLLCYKKAEPLTLVWQKTG